MVFATQIAPLIDAETVAVLVLVVLVTRLHLRLANQKLGVLWRCLISTAFILAPTILLGVFGASWRSLLGTLSVVMGLFLGLPILVSRNVIRDWLIAKRVPSWISAVCFVALCGALFLFVEYLTHGTRNDPLLWTSREIGSGWWLFLLPMLIAERSVHISRWANSRACRVVSVVIAIAFVALAATDFYFLAHWRQLLPPQIWHSYWPVREWNYWIIVSLIALFPSRFVVPYFTLGFLYLIGRNHLEEAEIFRWGLDAVGGAILSWTVMALAKRFAPTKLADDVETGGLASAPYHPSR